MNNVSDSTQLLSKIKVNIPESVINKIKYLCTVIPNLEWSGVLFYTVEGTIKEPSGFSINLKDILPMDRGTAGSTEFTYDKRYVDFLMNNEERLEWRSGLIHSHNNMGVFFSGVDNEELSINSKAHNYYLSVVVNNRLDIIGRIAINSSVEATIKADFNGLDENGDPYIVDSRNLKIKKDKLYHYECEMIYDTPQVYQDKEFLDNVSTILEDKRLYPKTKSTSYQKDKEEEFEYPFGDWGNNWRSYNNPVTSLQNKSRVLPIVENKKKPKSKTSEEDFSIFVESNCEDFIKVCFDYDDLFELSLEDVLSSIDESIVSGEFTPPEILEDFIVNFQNEFDTYFRSIAMDDFVIVKIMRKKLQEYRKQFGFLEGIINFLIGIENEWRN
ncbi:MAG TPA: hypothetical protein P5513_07515 [Candidatus Diapherotrites archaeon]|nr:hypothetical protein [Candidatus Diapherotrites archaeon]